MEKKLHRDEYKKVLGGVCAGLAEYFELDVSIVRVVFLLALLLKGGGFLLYIVLWIVLPKKGFPDLPSADYTVPPGATYRSPNTFDSPSAFQERPAYVRKKGTTTGTLIGGLVMILLGIGFLLDQFNIIPDWDFEDWWPVILIVIGLVLIFTHKKQEPAAFQVRNDEPLKSEPVNETPADEKPLNNE